MKLKFKTLALSIGSTLAVAVALGGSLMMTGCMKGMTISDLVEQTCNGANAAEEGGTTIRHDSGSKYISDVDWHDFQDAVKTKHKYCSQVPLPTTMTTDDWKQLNGAIARIISHYNTSNAAKIKAEGPAK